MRKSLISFAKWICRQLTENDFASLMVILLEVLSGKHSDFKFRQPKPTPNYRDFRQDDEEPLDKPAETDNVPKYDWRELRKKYQKVHN